MSDRDQILWKGKPAEDLTREEAIEAFKQTFRALADIMELKQLERVGRYERFYG